MRLHFTEAQRSNHRGAEALIETLPPAKALLADRAYDSRWFREVLAERGMAACSPSQRSRKMQHPCVAALNRQRHGIENMFARTKDWRLIHTRYDRCANIFIAAIILAAIAIFWIIEY